METSHLENTLSPTSIMFKSYYVVWKLFAEGRKAELWTGLNRTM